MGRQSPTPTGAGWWGASAVGLWLSNWTHSHWAVHPGGMPEGWQWETCHQEAGLAGRPPASAPQRLVTFYNVDPVTSHSPTPPPDENLLLTSYQDSALRPVSSHSCPCSH